MCEYEINTEYCFICCTNRTFCKIYLKNMYLLSFFSPSVKCEKLKTEFRKKIIVKKNNLSLARLHVRTLKLNLGFYRFQRNPC